MSETVNHGLLLRYSLCSEREELCLGNQEEGLGFLPILPL